MHKPPPEEENAMSLVMKTRSRAADAAPAPVVAKDSTRRMAHELHPANLTPGKAEGRQTLAGRRAAAVVRPARRRCAGALMPG